MNVYYCPVCCRYFYIVSYANRNACKVCGQELFLLPISFVDFTKLDEGSREQFIKEVRFEK